MSPVGRRPPTIPAAEFPGPVIARGSAGDCCVLCGRVGINLSDEHGCVPDVDPEQLQASRASFHRLRDGRSHQSPQPMGPIPPMTLKRLAGLLRTVATAPEGQRNSVLYWAARRAAEAGYGPVAAEALADAARTAGETEPKIRSSLRSAGCRP